MTRLLPPRELQVLLQRLELRHLVGAGWRQRDAIENGYSTRSGDSAHEVLEVLEGPGAVLQVLAGHVGVDQVARAELDVGDAQPAQHNPRWLGPRVLKDSPYLMHGLSPSQAQRHETRLPPLPRKGQRTEQL